MYEKKGHKGKDGRYYLLDYSRTFPCVRPDGTPGGHLFRLFRPEFVVNFKFFPLCSDAYSRFVSMQPDYEQHSDEVDNATNELINVTIPNFARELLQLMEIEAKAKGTIYDFRLTEILHSQGSINEIEKKLFSYFFVRNQREVLGTYYKEDGKTQVQRRNSGAHDCKNHQKPHEEYS